MKKKLTGTRTGQKRNETGQAVDRFAAGVEPEVTKTFRIPLRLSRQLKIHAAQTAQTEKDILIRLLTEYLENQ